tara:strand:+ start:735 stop:1223 length:489 start_codon:yes stop_codon:yes gene_type:complete
MNKLKYIIVVLISFLSCSEEPTQFSEAALKDVFETLNGDIITFKDILETQNGKTIVIDIWASWCSDCIKGMPKVKALQEAYKDVAYIFMSLDRTQDAWIRGIKKYDLQGEHYFMPSAKKSAFADFVNISWIPRYMVINKAGEIVVFDVIEADDNKLIEALKN